MPYCTTSDGTEMFYADAGSGPPVLLVHGGFMSHRVFDHQVAALADDYRVLAVDLPGHGNSGKPHVEYTAERYARDVHDLLTELDLTDVRYVGWSLGATIGATYVGLYGDRVSRLGLVCSGIFHGLAARDRDTDADGLDFDALVEAHRTNHPVAMEEFAAGLFADDDPPEPMVRWIWNIGMETPVHVALDVLDVYASMDYDELYGHVEDVTVPVGVFQGAHDGAATVEEAEYVAEEVFENGTAVGFDDSGHLPFLEEQAAFTETLEAFLAGDE